jgi:hypothetical protein
MKVWIETNIHMTSKQDRKFQFEANKNIAQYQERSRELSPQQRLNRQEQLTGCRFGKPRTCRNPECEHNAHLDM